MHISGVLPAQVQLGSLALCVAPALAPVLPARSVLLTVAEPDVRVLTSCVKGNTALT